MSRSQVAVVGMIVVAASSLSALVAYRRALRTAAKAAIASVPAAAAREAMAGCVETAEAQNHVGEQGCVQGTVVRVYTSRSGNTFLDFCRDYRQCPFTTVIFNSDHSKFGDLATLTGRRVEILGTITSYRDRAQIIIHDPDQIRPAP